MVAVVLGVAPEIVRWVVAGLGWREGPIEKVDGEITLLAADTLIVVSNVTL